MSVWYIVLLVNVFLVMPQVFVDCMCKTRGLASFIPGSPCQDSYLPYPYNYPVIGGLPGSSLSGLSEVCTSENIGTYSDEGINSVAFNSVGCDLFDSVGIQHAYPAQQYPTEFNPFVEVESFEILRNVAEKVGNKIQRIHKALHPHHGRESVVTQSTTAIPDIDIRIQFEDTDTNQLSDPKKIYPGVPNIAQAGSTTTDTIPTIDGRSIIGAPCANNMQRTADGTCRRVFA
ncbi:hypothetical protein CBL_01731 [Carabus blaptoides fortunei]